MTDWWTRMTYEERMELCERVVRRFRSRLAWSRAQLWPHAVSVMLVDGVPVQVDWHFHERHVVIHVCAPVPGAGKLRLTIEPGRLHPIERLVGRRDELVADEEFDAQFVVKSRSQSLARAWLDAPVREAMARSVDLTYRLRGARLQVRWVLREEAEPLVLGIRAVAALAGRQGRAGAQWRSIAKAIGARYTGSVRPTSRTGRRSADIDWDVGGAVAPFHGLRIETTPDQARLSIDTWFGRLGRSGGERLFTRVRCTRHPDQGPEQNFRWTPGTPPPAWLDPADAKLLAQPLGAGALAAAYTEREEVLLFLDGLLAEVADARTLLALAGALRAGPRLRTGEGGPYR